MRDPMPNTAFLISFIGCCLPFMFVGAGSGVVNNYLCASNFDVIGGFVGESFESTLEDCASQCDATYGCDHFAFVDSFACWLKNLAFTGHAGKNSGATGSAVNMASCLSTVVYGM